MDLKRITFQLEIKQIEGLKILSKVTRIKQAEFVREGIDMVLGKYQKEIKKGKKERR